MARSSLLLEKLKTVVDSTVDVHSLVHDIATGLCAREVSLQEVVEALGPSLTHQWPREREVGTHLLAGALDKLPHTYLNPSEASFVAAFFIDRLQDHHSVQPAVFLGILALVKQDGLGDGEVCNLLDAIFREVQVQSHIMSDRRTIYRLFKYCVAHRLDALKGLGSPLLAGIIGAADGERDPRNLLLTFSLIKELATSGLKLEPFTEELFEVVAAYFPISFVPPRHEPHAVQTEDLVLALRQALASTPVFGPYCLPLLLEKLDSDLISAKLDSLHTLVACCDVYQADDLQPHAMLLWRSLLREALHGAEHSIKEASLSAVTSLVRVLETGVTNSSSRAASTDIAQSALAECCSHIEKPEQLPMWPCVRLLLAVVVAAENPASTIISKVVPLLSGQCLALSITTTTNPQGRQNTVSALAMFLEAATKHPHLLLEDGLLAQLSAQVWEALSRCLSDPQVQEATLSALPAALPALPSLSLQQAAQTLTALLLDSSTSTSASDFKKEGIRACLVRLSQHSPAVILSHVLPRLLPTLHPGVEELSRENEVQVLESLSSLTSSKKVLSSLLPEVWRRAEGLLSEGQLERCALYLSTVEKMVEGRTKDPEGQKYLLEEWKGIEHILGIFSSLIQQSSSPHLPCLLSLASTLRILVSLEKRPQALLHHLISLALSATKHAEGGEPSSKLTSTNSDKQEVLTHHLTVLSLDIKKENITGESNESKDKEEGERKTSLSFPLQLPPNFEEQLGACLDYTHLSGANYMLYVLEGVVGGAESLPEEDDCLLRLLRRVRVFCASPAVGPVLREVAVLLHSATLNKLQEDVLLSKCKEEVRQCVETGLDSAQPTELRLLTLPIATWTCKALVKRGSDCHDWWTKKLLSLLADPQLGVPAALCFETVVKEHPYALRQHFHACVRLLYRQRFFESVVGPLVETFRSTQGSHKTCCLIALCSMLPHLPQPILKLHVEKVLLVVLQGVAADKEQVVIESVVETLAFLLHHSPLPAITHLSFLLPALLTLTSKQPLAVRMKALDCLKTLATLPTTPLLPYRDDVLRGLKVALDDHKRVVRYAAGNTRTAWVMVGAPGHAY